MAKTSIIAREHKKQKLVNSKQGSRRALKLRQKQLMANSDADPDELMQVMFDLQKLPRSSSKTRLRNRCQETGRPRGVFGKVGLCRNMFRKYAMEGLIPGIVKASW